MTFLKETRKGMTMELGPQSAKIQKNVSNDEFSMDEFDFKPITSGLGFHHQKTSDIKPVFVDQVTPTLPQVSAPLRSAPITQETPVYHNDLSLFYKDKVEEEILHERAQPPLKEVSYQLATRGARFVAYCLDLVLVASTVALVIFVMAKSIRMDVTEFWLTFPQEMVPFVIVLFVGIYLIYFSIFDKSPGATLGKNCLGLKVVDVNNKSLSFLSLLLRSFVTLLGFLSLGLFAWFDLQNKATSSKVVKEN